MVEKLRGGGSNFSGRTGRKEGYRCVEDNRIQKWIEECIEWDVRIRGMAQIKDRMQG